MKVKVPYFGIQQREETQYLARTGPPFLFDVKVNSYKLSFMLPQTASFLLFICFFCFMVLKYEPNRYSTMALVGPITLVYFNLRGRGELPRLIMHAAGQPFDETEDKELHADSLLFGQVPLLIDADTRLVQSRTIVRYLAKRLGLCGKSESDELLCDQFFEGTEDIFEALWSACVKYRGGTPERIEKTLAEGGNVHKYLVKI